jgi:hypothetical protein
MEKVVIPVIHLTHQRIMQYKNQKNVFKINFMNALNSVAESLYEDIKVQNWEPLAL